ncbi:multidrug efflux pump subunit AcrB [Thermonema lapsum]|uniref:Multidrug efflux pump subunit AcrB n=1 Tax=Thermonema lapsum TaxID=28195 RepID=A0A846MTD5_9BACT|nr:efflux RND transporter permease subunit [Thermonema lapsum]NIK74715.1 multidrug efflux pump subunit AcrB [Thermonema lapsum]
MSSNKQNINEQKPHIKKEFGLTNLAVGNTTSVLILTVLIVLFGVMSYVQMPKETFPEIVIPTIYVGTPYPGNSPIDMENLVTRPIEKEIKSISGIKNIKSTSIQDYSTIIVEFNPDVEVEKALQDVKDAVDRAELPNDLPSDPNVFDINLSEIPIMFINISGNYDLETLKKYAEYLQDEIEKLPEISEAPIRGALEREVKIEVDPFKMEARRVSFMDVENAIKQENITLSGGNIKEGDFRRTIRIDGEFKNREQIENIVVKQERGEVVYLKDIADVFVENSYKERESYARSSGLPVVTINVVKRSGENLIDAADKIKQIIEDAKKKKFPEDLNITITNDQSKRTRSQLANLENSIISGVILVVLVLLFFLGLRNALFVGIAIPLSMFMSFMILDAAGVTLNLMVLFSLILALGMLVDNGIVIIENIYRQLEEGKPILQAVKEGVGEVAVPIIASTATTVVAFVPLAFWSGIIGEFMKYLPITLIITLSSSLFVALVVNPAFAVLFMRKDDADGKASRNPKTIKVGIALTLIGIAFFGLKFAGALSTFTLPNLFVTAGLLTLLYQYALIPATHWFQDTLLPKIEAVYSRFVRFALQGRNPYYFLGGTFLLLIFSIMLLGISAPKVNFFPVNEPEYINVFIEKPIGTDIEATNRQVEQIEKDLMQLLKPYDFMVESFIAQVGAGTGEDGFASQGGNTPHKGKITVGFVEYELRNGVSTAKLMEDVRRALNKYPGVIITVEKNRNGPPVGKPINIEVAGEDYDKLIAISQQVINRIEAAGIPGIEELKTDLEIGKPELVVEIDREKARRFGISTYSIANEIRTALFGKEVSKFKEGEDEYPIYVRLKEEYRHKLDVLLNKNITFRNNTGQIQQVPISAVADVRYSSTYGSVKRKDLDRVISIYSNVKEGYNANEIVQQIKNELKDLQLPEGYSVKFTGEQEEQQKSMQFLLKALLIAVFAIFLIIVTQFNSVSAPFIIMTSVLFSTIGVFLGLVAFQMDFIVIMTGIGIISLAGVVVNNAIVLIDYTNLTRKRRKAELGLADSDFLSREELIEVVAKAGQTRLRPVLLTAITTILGLVPLAIGLNIDFFGLFARFEPNIYYGGNNANFWGPMAWTVIFGLTFATFLTLVIVPVMYMIADRMKMGLRKSNAGEALEEKKEAISV